MTPHLPLKLLRYPRRPPKRKTSQEPSAPGQPVIERKRRRVRITIQQMKELLAAFREHSDDTRLVLYADKLDITISSVENIFVKLRRGENMTPKGYYNQKSRVDPFQYLVRREVELDPTVPMLVVRDDLEAIVERYGGDVEASEQKVSMRRSVCGTKIHNRPRRGHSCCWSRC